MKAIGEKSALCCETPTHFGANLQLAIVDGSIRSDGSNLEEQIERFFSDERILYLNLHNAKPGCFSRRVDRAD
ncbi:DUF1203 domain-containing protein [bacterium]|nr:DUF1203 domain-containing protein [bacterium]MCI0606933.1 DUF1203 domain-containing protein [bacterium]